MRNALRATGRPIVFSMCEWGQSSPWTWARGVAHLWRTTGDILPCWACRESWGGHGWSEILDMQAGLEKFAGPGSWNDPDMLQVGNTGMTSADSRAHFAFWALLAAPLMAGNDVRSMPQEVRDILLNREVIAVNQDPLGRQGRRIRDDGDVEVWAKPLQGGAHAVILFNRGKSDATVAVSWHELGLAYDAALPVRDLWQHKDLGSVAGTFSTRVAPREIVMVRVGG
jgi:alpha-galactosidase